MKLVKLSWVPAVVLTAGMAVALGSTFVGGAAATAQSAPCPSVQVFVDAGTYAFDAYRQQHPGAAIPPSFIPGGMAVPLQNLSADTSGRISYYTVDYPAQPNTWFNWAGIFQSEQAGVVNTENAVRSFVASCPNSSIALYGYSQGAWVAGDVATDIANHANPASPAKLKATFLQADPVQTPGRGTFIGPRVSGTGVLPARYAGFGGNNATTFEFCATGDLWCNSSVGVPQIAAAAVNNPAHGTYDTYQVAPGVPTTQWIKNYLVQNVR
ncbi:MAG: cutinase family protein [Jatrophihabitans sp.]